MTKTGAGRQRAGTAAAPPDRRWLSACLGLALGPLAALGLARFAYSLLLPAMRTDLGWSYAQAGALSTANALGYLAGALAAGPLARRLGSRVLFAAGMAVTTAALLGAGLTPGFVPQLILRLIAGLGAAGTFISGAALVARLGDRTPRRSGMLLTLYTAGAGVGILVSGLLVPPVLHAAGWRWSWIVLAALAAGCLVIALPALRGISEPGVHATEGAGRSERGWITTLWLPGIGYLLFGGGYIAYVTFVIAYLQQRGYSAAGVTAFWAVLGLAVLGGVVVWGRIVGRLRSGHALAAMSATLVIGSVLPLLAGGVAVGLISAIIFGSTFMAVPAAMAHLVRRRLPPGAWAGAIAGLTVLFAAGQSIGPGLAGILADQRGGAGRGLLLATVVLAVTAITFGCSERARRSPELP